MIPWSGGSPGRVPRPTPRLTHASSSVEQEQARLRGEELNFAFVESANDDVVLGGGSLYDVDFEQSRAAVGYWLAPAARGRGEATHAVRLVQADFGWLGMLTDAEDSRRRVVRDVCRHRASGHHRAPALISVTRATVPDTMTSQSRCWIGRSQTVTI